MGFLRGPLSAIIVPYATEILFQLRPHQQIALDALRQVAKGICVFPTGGGKTNVGIFDAIEQFLSDTAQTIVVVAPRILLAEQLSSEYLEFITNAHVMHVHTGETHHFSSTRPNVIRAWWEQVEGHKLIFTTYNSLQQLQRAGIAVDTIYFDEAHNSVKRNFFPATEYFASEAKRCYFFTATPKYSSVVGKPGMNDVDVYGQIIAKVPAPNLVQGGYIIPPKVMMKEMRLSIKGEDIAQRDCEYLLQTIADHPVNKILICAKATKHIVGLLSETDFADQLAEQGYSVMHITSKHGAFIDGKIVNREVFFDTLNQWGKDADKKFVVLHHSILAEGINISALEAVVFMRSMDVVGIGQTVGRTLRLHPQDAAGIRSGALQAGNLEAYTKSYGLVICPTFDKASQNTARAVQNVVDIIFKDGDVAVSTIRR
jgi:superfamily II DNA or RNA helicase